MVGSIPEFEGKLLLCRRAIEPRYGYWTLPAGFMENGETTAQAALRETLEEAGAQVELGAPFSMISVPHVNQVHLFYRARLRELDFKPGEETLEVALWEEDADPVEGHRLPHRRPDAEALVRRPRPRRFRLPRRGPTIKSQQRGGWTMKILIGLLAAYAPAVLAQAPAAAPKIDPANTAWMLTASVLVLFMTLPGLALFYAGLVRTKNVLSVLMQCFAITCIVTLAWLVVGYSIAFGDGNAWWGGLGKAFFSGIDVKTVKGSIPETVFAMYQMTFAIITPALVIGAYAERVRFGGMLLFSLLWLLIVYCPLAHWVWGDGWLQKTRPDGLRRRHGGAPERRHGGAGLRAGPRAPARLPRDRRCRRTT